MAEPINRRRLGSLVGAGLAALGVGVHVEPAVAQPAPVSQLRANSSLRFVALYEQHATADVRYELARTWIDAYKALGPFRCDGDGECSAVNTQPIAFDMQRSGYANYVGFGDETGELLFYVPLGNVAYLFEHTVAEFQPGHLTLSHVNNGMTEYAERKILSLFRELAGTA